MNRKIRFVLATLLFAIIGNNGFGQSDKPVVLASASMFADMAKNIGGDFIEVDLLVPIGGDPHLYQATPKDAQKLSKADAILMNGLTFEGWINELIENSGTKASVHVITKGITPISSTEYENAFDPHAWMDPTNGIQYVRNITDAIVNLVPKHKAEIEENSEAYEAELIALDEYAMEKVNTIPEQQRVLITSHDAFAYFGKRYGIALEPVMGISTEADVQTSDIVRVMKIIKEKNIPTIFIESTINPKLLQQIAKDSGAKIGGELFSDSLGEAHSDGGTYVKMIKHNVDVIVNALSSTSLSETKLDNDKGADEKSYLVYVIAGFLLLTLLAFFLKMNN